MLHEFGVWLVELPLGTRKYWFLVWYIGLCLVEILQYSQLDVKLYLLSISCLIGFKEVLLHWRTPQYCLWYIFQRRVMLNEGDHDLFLLNLWELVHFALWCMAHRHALCLGVWRGMDLWLAKIFLQYLILNLSAIGCRKVTLHRKSLLFIIGGELWMIFNHRW